MLTSTARRKRRNYSAGDLNEKIKLQVRAISSIFQTGDEQEIGFSDIGNPWACVQTVRGKEVFDGIELKKAYTHTMVIRYRKIVDQTVWVLYRGNRYDIVDSEDLDERHEYLMLKCKLTGPDDADHTASGG